jgi:chromosome segregation ATPase
VLKNTLLILIALLIGIILFSVWRYVLVLREKQGLLESLNQIKAELSQVEAQREQLNQQLQDEKSRSAQEKQAGDEKLAKLEEALDETQRSLDKLNRDMVTLKEENTTLRQDKDNLSVRVDKLTFEKTNLVARLNSFKELKKVFRDLTIKTQRAKFQMRQSRIEVMKKEDQQKLKVGNRGYVIRNSKPTLNAKVRIEVLPAQ